MVKSSLFKALPMVFVLVFCVASVGAQTSEATTPAIVADRISPRVLEDRAVKAGWLRYGLGEKPGFSIILPELPQGSAEAAGVSVVNTYTAMHSSGFYAAARVDRIPTNMETGTEETRDQYVQSFFTGFASGFQKGVSSRSDRSDLTLQLFEVTKVKTATSREGYQQRFTVGEMKGRAQMVFVGNSAFCILSVSLTAEPTPDHEMFFNSFRLDGVSK